MNTTGSPDGTTVVVGFGSPHGDDQAGWRVAEMLNRRPRMPAQVITADEPTQVFKALQRCQRLFIVDACRSGGAPGTITRLTWPDSRIGLVHGHSTHGFSVAEVLGLAEKLGVLPPTVEIFGIEGQDYSPGRELTPAIELATLEVENEIVRELCEAVHA